jgi:hypothetical protein
MKGIYNQNNIISLIVTILLHETLCRKNKTEATWIELIEMDEMLITSI